MFLQVCVCPWGGGGIPACIASGIPACLEGFQAHSQGGKLREIWLAGSPSPHPRGKLRGIRPGGLQAHTQGGACSMGVPALGGGVCVCVETPQYRVLLWAVCILLECILVTYHRFTFYFCSITSNDRPFGWLIIYTSIDSQC